MPKNVLVVDDTETIVRLLEMHLASHGFDVSTANTGEEALTHIDQGFKGTVLLDLNLPDYKDLELFNEIRKRNENLPIIIITAFGTVDMAIEAIRLGAFDFLVKTDALLDRVYVSTKNAFAQLTLHGQLQALSSELRRRYKFEQIISASEPMRRVLEVLEHAVESRVTVLVQGASGTGKELIARALHYNGERKEGPFVAVNVAGIPETLLESELFGYERGAFTGATARKYGKFELANHGTLFLDEIGEMPMLLQAKLLRALQEREIERLGGTQPIPLDVRIVCATNRDLKVEIEKGRFREDLYYRLAVFPITIPPLNERLEDIPLLAQHFLAKSAAEEGKEIDGFDGAVLVRLSEHNYPGNVRELENIVRHAVVVARGKQIQLSDLPPSMLHYDTLRGVEAGVHVPLDQILVAAIRSVEQIPKMEEIEARVIERTVELCNGNLAHVARRLGISRATIYRRISKLGLERVH
jgi:DNA-binding NtrC family response regulator